MVKLKPILQKGWTCKQEVLDRSTLRYIRSHDYRRTQPHDPRLGTCVNCSNTLELGVSRIWVLRDDRGLRRAVFCSVLCQRQYRLDAFAQYRRPSK